MLSIDAPTLSPRPKHRRRLLIWYWGRRGGGPQYCYEMTQALLQRDDFDICLSLSRQSDLYDRFTKLQVPSLDVDTYTDLGSALKSLVRLPRLRRSFARFLDEQKIDAVLCTMAHLWNPLFLDLIHARNLPYILTVHDATLHPGERIAPYQRWLDSEIRRADGLVTLSRHVMRTLHARHSLQDEASVIAPMGPLLKGRIIRQPQSNRPPRRLMFFGRILEYKGIDLLLDSFSALSRDYPDLTLAIHGSGNMAPYASRLAGLPNVTLDNRFIPEDDIPAILARADLMVLPYREASQSGVIAVAQSCGIPVVVTPVGGLVEQVVHRETGLVADQVSAESLTAAIRTMLDDTSLYAHCAQGGIQHSVSAWNDSATLVTGLIDRLSAQRERA